MAGESTYERVQALERGMAALTERVGELEAALEGAARHLAVDPRPIRGHRPFAFENAQRPPA